MREIIIAASGTAQLGTMTRKYALTGLAPAGLKAELLTWIITAREDGM